MRTVSFPYNKTGKGSHSGARSSVNHLYIHARIGTWIFCRWAKFHINLSVHHIKCIIVGYLTHTQGVGGESNTQWEQISGEHCMGTNSRAHLAPNNTNIHLSLRLNMIHGPKNGNKTFQMSSWFRPEVNMIFFFSESLFLFNWHLIIQNSKKLFYFILKQKFDYINIVSVTLKISFSWENSCIRRWS